MKQTWFILLLLAIPFWSVAQLKPDFFPEDIETWDEQGRCIFCQPGVRNKSRSRGLAIVYGLQTQSAFEERDDQPMASDPSFSRSDLLMLDLKIPLVIKDHFKLLLTYKYLQEQYIFESFGAQNPEAYQLLGASPLKSNSFGLIISKPLDEDTYLAFQAKYASNGNYSGWTSFKKNAAIYKFRAILGMKPTTDFEWGLGLNLSQSFRRLTLIPFLVFNRNFNKKWGIESVFPAYVFARFNANDRNILLFGPQYVSRSYRLEETSLELDAMDYAFNHSEVLTSLRWEHQWVPWVWSSVRAGYQINFNTDFESQNPQRRSFQAAPSDAPHFEISLFLSPPK